MTASKSGWAAFVATGLAVIALAGCATSRSAPERRSARPDATPEIVVRHAHEGEPRWVGATSADELGRGAEVTLKIDRVPRRDGAARGTRDPAASTNGEDELVYVVRGRGLAVTGLDQQEVPIEEGSIIYVPADGWHGFRNADPAERMERVPAQEAAMPPSHVPE